MKRNAVLRIVLWSIVLAVLLAILFILLYVPGAGRRMRNETPVETAIPARLERVTIGDTASGNAITTSGLNVRSAPSTESEVVGFAEEGTVLNILRTETIGSIQWGYLGAPSFGWVAMDYVRMLEPVNEEHVDVQLTSPLEESQPILSTEESQIRANAIAMDVSSVRSIEIEWAAGSIVIQPKDITEIYIMEDGLTEKSEPMVWKLRDEKLAIQYSKNTDHDFGMGLLRGNESKDLIIQVPFNWACNSLEIDAASASLEINDLTIRDMEFDGASGTCVFNNCTVETLELDTASGDILFQGNLTRMDCDSASANILLDLKNVPKSLDLDTASGDLDVVLPENAGFTVNMDTMSGNFESDFATSMRNNNYIAGNGQCRIDVDAMSGSVTIRKGA